MKDDLLKTMTGLSYEESLDRCFEFIQINKDIPKIIRKIQPLKTKFENRRTVVYDFTDIFMVLDKAADHVFTYLINELKTEGSIKENKSLILKGRYSARDIENIIKRYKELYVTCKNCKDEGTKLVRDNNDRLNYVCCTFCKSRRAVTA